MGTPFKPIQRSLKLMYFELHNSTSTCCAISPARVRFDRSRCQLYGFTRKNHGQNYSMCLKQIMV
ncbi:hypothetical protein HZS_544 [Henneguya salminicola]|nr:hypothetical protein HZS_544 [Henneguya salminicola]